MSILNSKPPVYDRVAAVLDFDPSTVVFAYAPDIYFPSGKILSSDVIAHENVHITQQGSGPEAWWNRYISDVDFRLNQEIEAYQAQYRHICSVIKDRNARNRSLHVLAGYLSSAMYGNKVTHSEALKLIAS